MVKISKARTRALGILVAAGMLAGCGGSQQPIGTPGAIPRSGAMVMHAERGGSWMLPEATSESLLYVPDHFKNQVDVYTYPSGRLVGRLTGFKGPQGACVDRTGDIWITDQGSGRVVEYAHGGTKPISTLDLSPFPVDCSVDPRTGDLAVATIVRATTGGLIAIYKRAQGTPKYYLEYPQLFWVYFCGYDDKGNLFVDGQSGPNGQFQFAELPKGGSTLTNLSLSKFIAWPGGIQWDGRHVAVGNLLKGVVYRTSGSTIVRTVHFQGARGAVDFFIRRGQIIIGTDSGKGVVGIWNYPTGGSPVKTLHLPGRTDPVARAVVSDPAQI
jgi:hypothetical protein